MVGNFNGTYFEKLCLYKHRLLSLSPKNTAQKTPVLWSVVIASQTDICVNIFDINEFHPMNQNLSINISLGRLSVFCREIDNKSIFSIIVILHESSPSSILSVTSYYYDVSYFYILLSIGTCWFYICLISKGKKKKTIPVLVFFFGQ